MELKSCKILGALTVALSMVAAVPAIHAQTTHEISGGGAALQDAFAAAAAGDTILITDSATYEAGIDAIKPMTIIAAPGTSPVISGGTAFSSSQFLFRNAGLNSTLGSNDGGQITLRSTFPYSLTIRQDSLGSPATDVLNIENVVFDGENTTTAIVLFGTVAGTNEYDPLAVNFRNVVFDSKNTARTAIRDVLNTEPRALLDLTFEDCEFLNIANAPAFIMYRQVGTINIERCKFNLTGANGRVFYSSHRTNMPAPPNHLILNITDTWAQMDGAQGVRMAQATTEFAENTVLNITRSVFRDLGTANNANVLIGGRADNASVTIAESDFRGTQFNVDVAAGVNNVDVSITDSNLIAALNNIRNAASNTDGTASIDHSLLLLEPGDPGDPYTQGTTTGSWDVGANMVTDVTPPDYLDTANGDYRYTNVNQTASQAGTPLGSMLNFDGPELTITEPTISILQGTGDEVDVATYSDSLYDAGDITVSIADDGGFPGALSLSSTDGVTSASLSADCADDAGLYVVTLRAEDPVGNFSLADFTIDLVANSAPTLGDYANVTLTPGDSDTATPDAPPADVDDNIATVEVSPETLTGGGTVEVDPVTGVVTIETTATTESDTYLITVTVTDACGATAISTFDLTVETSVGAWMELVD